MAHHRHHNHRHTHLTLLKFLIVTTQFLSIVPFLVHGAFPPSLRYTQQQLQVQHQLQPPKINHILDVTATCDPQFVNVTIRLEKPFKGALFAKDFSQECRTLGSHQDSVFLSLPTSGCGVRLTSSSPMTPSDGTTYYYSLTFIVQQDKHLRQISDQERTVKCEVEEIAFAVRSKSMVEAVREAVNKTMENESHRTARMKEGGWSKDYTDDVIEHAVRNKADGSTIDNTSLLEIDESSGKALEEALSAARAWMEIVPVQETPNPGTISVGEETLLLVKSTLPAGIGWKVIDCTAHDGLGESSQKLLDEYGCPVDEQLLPELLKGPAKPIALMRHQEAVSKFAAFKFPDRDRLHLSCGLQLCRGACQKIDCHAHNGTLDNRLGRNLQKGDQGEILDRLEVFNSVEVLAPGIELEDLRHTERLQSDYITSTFGHIPGDRTVCVSPDKMAISLCALGLVFLIAVIIAACALYRARDSSSNSSGSTLGLFTLPPYYTRSLFSNSSSSGGGGGGAGGSGGGSGGSGYSGGGGGKMMLLQHIEDSPVSRLSCSGASGGHQPASGRGYGRIL